MSESVKRIYQETLEAIPRLDDKGTFGSALTKLRIEAGKDGKLAEITPEMIDQAKIIMYKAQQPRIYGHSLKVAADLFDKAGKPIGGATKED